MIFQLVYTSLERGLKSGQSGFGVAACSRSLPPELVARLCACSGYSALYPPHDPRAQLNPVSVFHYQLNCGGVRYELFGRIQPTGSDYSGRSNVLARWRTTCFSNRTGFRPATRRRWRRLVSNPAYS